METKGELRQVKEIDLSPQGCNSKNNLQYDER